MKKKLRLWLCIGTALILGGLFAMVFISYAQPTENEVYDLSPVYAENEVSTIDRSRELGWTVFTQEGETRRELVPDGFGCFEGLGYLGQTFYYSRIMQEELDAPTVQLGTANRNFSVFLDGILIYTDCPEQDNRIGYLQLPMRESDRKEDVTVSLPEDYVGKQLTIAQSTPLYAESIRMQSRVAPAWVRLYCSYAYESGLIAESFKTAGIGALCYGVGLLLLALFIRRLFQGQFDWGLLFLTLAVFLGMTERMYNTSYYTKYFGTPDLISTALLCRRALVAAVLAFFATQTTRMRIVPWALTGSYCLMLICFLLLGREYDTAQNLIGNLIWKMPDFAGGIFIIFMLGFSWAFRKSNAFYRYFAPLATGGFLIYLGVRLLLPSRAAFFTELFHSVGTMYLGNIAYDAAVVEMIVAIVLIVTLAVYREINLHTEKRLMLEMSRMAEQRYENLRKHDDEVMALRHDMNRHFTILRQMTAEEETARYLDELIGQNKKIRPVIQSGNEMMDLILSSRLDAAGEAGLQLEIVRASAPPKLPLTDTDLCSLTMNLIDNAIEGAAASGAAHPFLRLDLHVKNNFFVFVCENSAKLPDAPEEKKEAVPKHGFGLKIIGQIAERYDALLHTEQTPNQYKVSLAIPLDYPSK